RRRAPPRPRRRARGLRARRRLGSLRRRRRPRRRPREPAAMTRDPDLPTRLEVTVTVPATTANLGPGFDALGIALDLRLVVHAALGDDGFAYAGEGPAPSDRKSTRLNSSHVKISYAV